MFKHQPVLLAEVTDALLSSVDGRYIDATFGRGGHTRALLEHLSGRAQVLAMDRDPAAIASGMALKDQEPRLHLRQGRFSSLASQVDSLGWSGQVSGILLDLGVSSPQLDDPERGFSFLRDGPLDLRMDPHSGQSAAQWLMSATEAGIAEVLHEYGEERFARRIARAICEQRQQEPLMTTRALAALIEQVVPKREPGKHPATRTFQALRIEINGELDELRAVLPQALEALSPGGRLAVISFHSLEDRIVKQFMRDASRAAPLPKWVALQHQDTNIKMRLIGKARMASTTEIAANPRARSAVLRVAEKLA